MPDSNLGIGVAAANLVLSLQERSREGQRSQQTAQELGTDPRNSGAPPSEQVMRDIDETNESIRETVDRIEDYEDTHRASPSDKDAFTSATFDLDPGETAEITVEPQDGHVLRVKEVYVDRKTNHDYTLNVGGDVTSVSHRAKYMKPQLVSQGDRIIATITNGGSSTTTLDFELRAWAEEGRGGR